MRPPAGRLSGRPGTIRCLEVLVRRGEEHESELLAAHPGLRGAVHIEATGRTLADLELAAAATACAMRDGAPLIYQATFLHDGWMGLADFVERVDEPSDLGSWSYEVTDAKLSRSVRPSALVQLCEYTEHVTRIQGTEPQQIHVVTGDGVRHTFPLADCAAYHRTVKQRFRETVADGVRATYPEPVEHCGICRWWAVCRDKRRADDHLSLVAGMRRDQSRRLAQAGILTRTALAEAAADVVPKRMPVESFAKLRCQATLQVRGEGCTPPLHELLEPDAGDGETRRQGFGALPAPSPGDLFLDLEGDPYALDGGLDYLFGLVEIIEGKPCYHAFWAHTRAEERIAFRTAVELIVDRRRRYPDMHVYHYASYEASAFRRLMGAHGTCEDDVDTLLRAEVFVDLYRIVRQTVRLSTESYSLKDVEKLYFTRPHGAVMDAGSSIITYERYLVDQDSQLLDEIAAYNRDDCESLIGLRDWLEARRVDAEAQFGPIARPMPPDVPDPEPEPDERAQLVARLLDGIPDDETDRSREEQAQLILAHLLEWHRREAKPTWWRYFDRLNTYEPQDFIDDPDCIGGLELQAVLGLEGRSTVYRMRCEPQDHKFSKGDQPIDPETGKGAGTIVAIDESGVVDFKRSRKRDNEPLPEALIPGGPYDTRAQQAAIAEVAQWVADHDVDAPGPYRAVRDLLLRHVPRMAGAQVGVPLRHAGEPVLDAACRLALELDGGCLAVQGPPGAGKTYTGARMIVALLRAGRRVGITSTTHGAIGNLLKEVATAAATAGLPLHGMQKAEEDQATAIDGIELVDDGAAIEDALAEGTINLAAGTAWLWARPGLRDSIDVLVIDEAGQMSLADVTAVGTAARNLLLLGDPQQLAQPSQGSHPDGAGASALEHLLGDHATIPSDQGLFLDLTFRMHPAVCAYISEVAYDGRLESAPGREHQLVADDAGVWFVPVAHDGDRTRSRAEADAVAALFDMLVGTPWTNEEGQTRPLVVDDIIVVSPYNAHVAELRTRLPEGARVGHGRQVPGPTRRRRHLLHGIVIRGRGAARDDLPVRPPPSQRRGLARPCPRLRRRESRVAARVVQHAKPAPTRQRAVSLRRIRRRPRTTRRADRGGTA